MNGQLRHVDAMDRVLFRSCQARSDEDNRGDSDPLQVETTRYRLCLNVCSSDIRTRLLGVLFDRTRDFAKTYQTL